jgi:hypothetical protein
MTGSAFNQDSRNELAGPELVFACGVLDIHALIYMLCTVFVMALATGGVVVYKHIGRVVRN